VEEKNQRELRGVSCPLCGGIVEADNDEELIALATEHCELAHRYAIPREHILASARPADEL
jgi:hypothetical protein